MIDRMDRKMRFEIFIPSGVFVEKDLWLKASNLLNMYQPLGKPLGGLLAATRMLASIAQQQQ
jgi:hypothetical protein